MTLRHPIRNLATGVVVTLAAVVAVALPAMAHADNIRPSAVTERPSAPTPHVARPTVGKDELAVSAAAALYSWSAYAAGGSYTSLAQFESLRDSIAATTAGRLRLDPVEMQTAWRNADLTHQLVILTAFTQIGIPYRAYVRKPGIGFDCSALTSWAWEQSGVAIARNSRAQIRSLPPVTQDDAQPGDIIWYPGHVMLYLGIGEAMMHAPQRGKLISIGVFPKHRRSIKFANPIG